MGMGMGMEGDRDTIIWQVGITNSGRFGTGIQKVGVRFPMTPNCV